VVGATRTRAARLGPIATGVAGLAYVALAALEGADVLAAPERGDRATVVRAHLDTHADALGLTTVAGLLSLGCYAVFALGLTGWLRRAGAGRPAGFGLAGALGGAALAAAGQGLGAVALVWRDDLGDEDLATLWDLAIDLRSAAAPPAAVGLVGFGLALRRMPGVPRVGGAIALGLAGALALSAVLALARPGEVSRLVVVGAFALAAAWVFAVAAGFLVNVASPGPVGAAARLRQVVWLVLVAAAGVTGVALLVLPGATPQLFSWGLAPRPVAALVGGCYLASAVVFAGAVPAGRRASRSLVAAALVFATTTVVVSWAHTDVFDLDRVQAVAWFVLFPAFALAVAGVLLAERDRPGAGSDRAVGPPLAPGLRLGCASVAGALAVAAAALWVDPAGAGEMLPFPVPPLGGRFVGCWLALLATLAGWVAAHPGAAEARLPATALVAFPAAALVAAARVPTDLAGGGAAAGSAAAVVVVLAVGATTLAAARAAIRSEADGRQVCVRR
jgi:hypothetical protein